MADTEIMTLKEVAAYIGIHPVSAYRLAVQGRLPGANVAGNWLFRKDKVDDWLNPPAPTKESADG